MLTINVAPDGSDGAVVCFRGTDEHQREHGCEADVDGYLVAS